MSAVIEELRVNNFEGYKRAQVSFANGLNLIKGRNSAGKSTLLDALLFALYGEVPGVHKRLLVSRLPGRGELSAYVRFKSPASGSVVEVLRAGKLDGKGRYQTSRLALLIDGKEVAVEGDEDLRRKVAESLGASLRKFVNLIYVRQGRLRDTLEPRKEDMDLILGVTAVKELKEQMEEVRRRLERFEGKDASTELRAIEEAIIPKLKESLTSLEKDAARLRGETEKLRVLVEKAESPRLLELLGCVDERARLEEALRGAKAEIKALLSQAGVGSLGELSELAERLGERRASLEKLCAKLEGKVEELNERWGSFKGKEESLRAEIERHEELLRRGATACPTCGQTLTPGALQRILEEKRAKLQVLAEEEERLKRDYEKGREALEKARWELSDAANRLKGLEALKREVEEREAKAKGLEGELSSLNERIKEGLTGLGLPLAVDDPELKVKVAQLLPIGPEGLEEKRRELERKELELKGKLEEMERRRGELEGYGRRARELEGRLKAAGLARELSERLEKAMEARRKELLERIGARSLFYYERMTDQHDYDSIRVDPESYVVYVHPKGLTDHIPASRDGGGHQTLLALAVRLALLEALNLKSLLILDEPTYGVDSQNLPQLASYLSEASRFLAQTILVTHHDICEEDASNIIEVERAADGSSSVKIKL